MSRIRTPFIAGLSFCATLASARAYAQDEPIGFVQVQRGMRVEASGTLNREGALVASRLRRKPPGDRIEVVGKLREVAADGSSVRILSIPFSIDEDTEIRDSSGATIAVTSLEPGQWVRASGRQRSGGKIEARSIRRVEGRIGEREEIEGLVEEVTLGGQYEASLRIGPQAIVLPQGEAGASLLDPFERFPAGPRVVPRDDTLGYRAVDEEDFKPLTIPLFGDFRLGGSVRVEFRHEDNYDLNRRRNQDIGRGGVFTELRIAGTLFENLFLLAELRVQDQEVFYDHDRDLSLGERTRGGENFLFYRGLFGLPVDVQVGRQDFDEYREWVYDEDIDAARVFLRLAPVNLEFSVSEVLFDPGDAEENVVNYIGYGSVDVGTRHQVAAYVVDRRDRDNANENLSVGLRSRGEPIDRLRYWSELAMARGSEKENRISGYGLDVGATYVVDTSFEPSFTLGFAYGTGDRDPDDGVDRTFRQTGLQDNNSRWNSVTSFKYYGEVFEPELRNMKIFTAGTGVRPTDKTSIDLVYHYYLQAETTKAMLFPISNLRQNSNGESPHLGWETDLIVGFKQWTGFRIELVLGWFHPSSGFNRRTDAALAQLQVDYRF